MSGGGRARRQFDVAQQPEGGAWTQLRLHHARSADGGGDWETDPEPLLSAPWSDWATAEVRSPAVLLEGDELRMWFAGHAWEGDEVTHFAIGSRVCGGG